MRVRAETTAHGNWDAQEVVLVNALIRKPLSGHSRDEIRTFAFPAADCLSAIHTCFRPSPVRSQVTPNYGCPRLLAVRVSPRLMCGGGANKAMFLR